MSILVPALSCTAVSCPRLRDFEMSIELTEDEAARDVFGNIWCNHCQKHRELMNWGHAHRFPAVRARGKQWYAIVEGKADWYASVACGNQDMIDALYATLIEKENV